MDEYHIHQVSENIIFHSKRNNFWYSYRCEISKPQRPFSQECRSRNNDENLNAKYKTIDLTESFDQIFKEDLGIINDEFM